MTDPGQISAPRADSRTLKDCRSCSPTTRAASSVASPSMVIFTLSTPFRCFIDAAYPSCRILPAGRRGAGRTAKQLINGAMENVSQPRQNHVGRMPAPVFPHGDRAGTL